MKQYRNGIRLKNTLKKVHPEKYCLKRICKFLFYFGLGDYWYEDRSSPRWTYKIWAIISKSFLTLNVINEVLSHLRNDLTVKERNDALQLSIAHSVIWAKITVVYFRKDRIRLLLRTLVENRMVLLSSKLDKESVKKAMSYSLAVATVTFVTLSLTTIDGIMAYFKEGIPIRTEVTLYPGPRTPGSLAIALRFLSELHIWYIVSVMVFIDALSICCLTFTGFKFRRVRLYFESLGARFSTNPLRKHDAALERQFWKDFVVGIKLHDDALRCARSVQNNLGNIYSIQIVESIGLLVSCLIKLVTTERTFVLLLPTLCFTIGLIVITGAYMMDAAEISYEASLISTSIFHCGWENTRTKPGLRAMVVLAIQRSQVPVYMTAFGMIILSYSNFITVMRSSYSFFAVMY